MFSRKKGKLPASRPRKRGRSVAKRESNKKKREDKTQIGNIMFAASQIVQGSKDNIKSALPLKTNNSGTGLKPCSLDNFTQPADRLKSEKSVSKVDQSCSKISLGEKENSKPKIKAQEAKASHEDFSTDVMLEPDSDRSVGRGGALEPPGNILDGLSSPWRNSRTTSFYGDCILSLLDISSDDIWDSEPSDNESPSPLKASIDFPDVSLPFPELNFESLFEAYNDYFDDDDLGYFPLPIHYRGHSSRG